jgi:hypothetical protein
MTKPPYQAPSLMITLSPKGDRLIAMASSIGLKPGQACQWPSEIQVVGEHGVDTYRFGKAEFDADDDLIGITYLATKQTCHNLFVYDV